MTEPRDYERILVIRLGALGDFVQSLGPMKAIRDFHKKARIALLTTAPFEELARESGLFDEVWIDARPTWRQPLGWWRLARRLRAGRFDRVYDLQTSGRTARYWRLMGKPEWSGHAPGCSHPDPNPKRDSLHTIERQKGQLHAAGIDDVPLTDLSWVEADIARFGLPSRYALLVPGGAIHRPKKRWPAASFAELARRLAAAGLTPVLIGGPAEAPVMAEIAEACPGAVDLSSRTSFQDIAVLARGAAVAIGNDTGPMHLIAFAGCPSVALFSDESDPALCAQRPGAQGGTVEILRREPLAALPPETVLEKALGIARR